LPQKRAEEKEPNNGGAFQKQLMHTLLKMKTVTLNIVAWTQHPVMAALLQVGVRGGI